MLKLAEALRKKRARAGCRCGMDVVHQPGEGMLRDDCDCAGRAGDGVERVRHCVVIEGRGSDAVHGDQRLPEGSVGRTLRQRSTPDSDSRQDAIVRFWWVKSRTRLIATRWAATTYGRQSARRTVTTIRSTKPCERSHQATWCFPSSTHGLPRLESLSLSCYESPKPTEFGASAQTGMRSAGGSRASSYNCKVGRDQRTSSRSWRHICQQSTRPLRATGRRAAAASDLAEINASARGRSLQAHWAGVRAPLEDCERESADRRRFRRRPSRC